MNIETLTVGPFAMNCYILSDPETAGAVIIDPGAEAGKIISVIEKKHLTPAYILNTHCHVDHAGDVKRIQDYFQIPFYIHEEELALLESLEMQGTMFGLSVSGKPEVSSFLNDNQEIEVGSYRGTVLHTPGHSPGSISVSFPDHVFVGDCLFKDSIGRTDLYEGNYRQLMDSIKTKLLVLDENTSVYSGHGPVTTIGREKKYNPFLTGQAG